MVINDWVFGENGLLASKFSGYVSREGQIQFVNWVRHAFRENRFLLIEAGTGTGKTFGYIVPVIEKIREQGRDTRAILVTANIALQEQVVNKDLPFLQSLIPNSFSFSLLKGRNNYLCLDRLREGSRFPLDSREIVQNNKILHWADQTQTGDRSELDFEPSDPLWNRFSVSSDDCHGSVCEYYSSCFAEKARNIARQSNIIVVNYHLFFSAIRFPLAKILSPYQIVVFDEAHRAVDIARDFFGFKISANSFAWAAKNLKDELAGEIEVRADEFFEALKIYQRSSAYKSRLRSPRVVLFESLVEASKRGVIDYIIQIDSMGSIYEMRSSELRWLRKLERKRDRLQELYNYIVDAMILKEENVYFIENAFDKTYLSSKPIHVAEILQKHVFVPDQSVVMTSATLVTQGNSFDYAISEFGVPSPLTAMVPSPFNWQSQAMLVLPGQIPHPNDCAFPDSVKFYCEQVILAAKGRTLCLFTSKSNMDATHRYLMSRQLPYQILKQNDLPKVKLIEEFKRDLSSVLLGVASFWEGIDVPGEALSCVLIDRLPFGVKDDPMTSMMMDRDPNSFMKWTLPRSIITLKQGFGRLIRTERDRGVVVILDSRLTSSSYGQLVLRSLPPVRRSSKIEDISSFLDQEIKMGRSLFDW